MNQLSPTLSKFKPANVRILAIAAYLLGIWYFCIRILGYNLEFIPGDLGDSRFINYLLEHGYQWTIGNADSFWNAGFMFPFENSIALSDNMIGTVPIYDIWRMLGFEQETAYQLWWITICSLNYWICYIIIKKWFSRWDLAILAAFIFAFTIFNIGQLNYMQMMIRFMVPVVIYAAVKLVDTSSIKYFIIFCLGIVYQFYCVIYTGFFLLYFSLFLIVIYAVVSKKYWFFVPLFRKNKILITSITIIVSFLTLGWLMLPYYEMSKLLGLRLYDEVKWSLPVILSYFYPHESAYAWQVLTINCRPAVDTWWIHYTFPGIIPLLGILVSPFLWIYLGVRKIKMSKLNWSLSICIFVLFLLFIRTYDGLSFYALIFKLPGMNSMRVLNRFMHVELFLVIAFLVSVAKNLNIKWSILFFLLIVLDNSFTPEKVIKESKSTIVSRRVEALNSINKVIAPNHKTFAIIDTQEDPFKTHLDAMIASNYLNIPTINGYSSGSPNKFDLFFRANSEEGLKKWMKFNDLDETEVLIVRK